MNKRQNQTLFEDTINKAIELAIECQKTGDFVTAESLYETVLKQLPEHPVAKFLLQQVAGANAATTSGSKAQKFILNAFQNYASHYTSVPPININWMLTDLSTIEDFLSDNPIVIADIGAHGGTLNEIENLERYIKYYAFDADDKECDLLETSNLDRFHEYRVFPYYVGGSNGVIDFNIYKDNRLSSSLKPATRFQKLFGNIELETTVKVESLTLDTIISRHQMQWPDFIKLDTQGTELEILQNSPLSLGNVFLVESEIEFVEIYDGQPLFHDVAKFMNENGFELLYLNRVFLNRADYQGQARGQIAFCDALFGRKETHFDGIDTKKLAKYMIILINYGHIDIAMAIWSSYKSVRELLPDMSSFFVPYKNQQDREYIMNHDKSLFWQLHQRKTNQLPMDSDRSWPIR